MNISILEKIKLEKIPSGSGLIKSTNTYYIVGDDSPFLFSLDINFKVTSQTPLIESITPLDNGRIIKSEKPDFEALEMINENEIIVFGSGSKSPQRDIFIRIISQDSILIENYDISIFYNELKKLPILQNSELNIEATAYHNNQIFLFNRKKNLIIQFDYAAFLSYLKHNTQFPQIKIRQYLLPKINGIEAGFSGATVLKKEPKILFTASVENTQNAYDDGEILGSYIGIIDISENNISDNICYCQIPNEGVNLKLESVCVEEEILSGKTKVVLITDDDNGNSVILKSIVEW